MAEGIGILIRPWVRRYVASVALNGVPIRYPQIDPVTNNWMLFDPIANVFVDTGLNARGASPDIDMTTGNWLLWDDAANQYINSGIPARGPQGEVPQFRMFDRMIQYRFATQMPNVWTDLYEFPAAMTYTHTQTAPANVWNIQHNLGHFPVTVFAVDTYGNQIVGQVDTNTSTDNLIAYRFSEPLAGRAEVK